MKLLSRLSALLAVCLLASCATTSMPLSPKPPRFVGKWVNRDGTLLTLRHDGTFDAQFTESSTSDIWGDYTIIGDKIHFLTRGGHLGRGCNRTLGVYRYVQKEDTLLFRQLKDPCSERAHQFREMWHRP
jgi:hypothetical protein